MHIAQGGLDAAVAHQSLQAFHRQAGRQLMGGIGVALMPGTALAPFIRDTPAGSRLRHPHGAGTAGTCGCVHDDDLYPCAQSTGGGAGEESGGRLVGRALCFTRPWSLSRRL